MNTRSSLKSKESPLLLAKILASEQPTTGREPNLLASPNAFDWEKRLTLPGGSPNAFALSLNSANVAGNAGDTQLFDYPSTTPTEATGNDDNDHHLSTIMLMDQMNTNTDHHNHNQSGQSNTSTNDSSYIYTTNSTASTDSPASISTGSNHSTSLFESLPPKRTSTDRRDSHRESERRRRETFKAAMFHLENLVVLTLNRGGSCKVLGKGPNRKLAHAEVYKMARDIIVTLKEEIAKVELINHEINMKLSMNSH